MRRAPFSQGVGGLAEQFAHKRATTSLAKAFRLLIASDSKTADELTPIVSASLMLAAHMVAIAMIHDDEASHLTDDWAVVAPVLSACELADDSGDASSAKRLSATRP